MIARRVAGQIGGSMPYQTTPSCWLQGRGRWRRACLMNTFMQVSRRISNAPGKDSLPPVTQVLDEGLASNLPVGALYQPGTPRPSIVALFSSCLQIVQIVIPPIILLPSFGHGMRLATLARTPITAQGGGGYDGSILRDPAGCGPPQPRPPCLSLHISPLGIFSRFADRRLSVFVIEFLALGRRARRRGSPRPASGSTMPRRRRRSPSTRCPKQLR